MGAASVSEYVASLNEEQRQHVSAFIDFMGKPVDQQERKSICFFFCFIQTSAKKDIYGQRFCKHSRKNKRVCLLTCLNGENMVE